jgi:hypothetical protein
VVVAPGPAERMVAGPAALEIELGRDIRVRIAATAPKELASAIIKWLHPEYTAVRRHAIVLNKRDERCLGNALGCLKLGIPPGPPSALAPRGAESQPQEGGNSRMDRISRRQIVRRGAAAAAAMTLGAPSVHPQKSRQTLRFVAHADLKVLDPVWTTAIITRNHSYLVYDTLFGTDENLQIKPQMVDRMTVSPDAMKYTFTLRDNLRWHDGQPVVSEDCVESLKRWGKNSRIGQLLVAHTRNIAPIDKNTFTLELAERFGPVLDALGNARAPFMMPAARIASTPPEEQIKEIVGSGPFKFRGTSGNRASRSCTCGTPTTFRATRRRADQPAARRFTLIRSSGGTSPTPGMRRTTSQRVRWIGGSSRRSTSSPRLNRTRIYRRSSSIPSGRKAGSGRTVSTRRSTTRRRARPCST